MPRQSGYGTIGELVGKIRIGECLQGEIILNICRTGCNVIELAFGFLCICFCFRFEIRIRMALTLINCTRLRTKSQSSGYAQAQIENHFQFLTASSAFVSCSLAVLLEVKMNRSSAVLCSIFSPSAKTYSCVLLSSHPLSPLMDPKSPSHPLTPVLRMRHLLRTTDATLGVCLSTDPIWWVDFLRRGKHLKGGRTLGA